LVAWPLLEGLIIVRDRWHPITQIDQAGQGEIAIILIATFIIASLVDKSDPHPMPGRPAVPLLFGDCLVWCGLALCLWSVFMLGRFFRATLVIQENQHVVQNGPY